MSKDITNNTIIPTYGRLPVAFVRGEGIWLWDTDDKPYLDAVSGIAVCGLGHSHPAITAAISAQAGTLLHTSNLYHIPLQAELADKLTALSGMSQAFFCNSGAEANETAIKIARKYGRDKGIDNPVILVMDGSFHGRTMATLSATGNPKVHAGFEPLMPGFVRVPYNDLDALKLALGHWPEAVAVMFEPAQGEGGVRILSEDYLEDVRALCDQNELLMMLDEVQTGIGRTGEWFAFQHTTALLPDVMMLAKGLGNGMPVGACLVHGAAVGVLQAGNHGSTFGGNPLACRVALTVLSIMEKENILAQVKQRAAQLDAALKSTLDNMDAVKDIRHHGLMFGITLDRPCAALVAAALAQGLLINVTADNVIRLLPPFIITEAEVQQLADKLADLISTFVA